MPAIEKGVRGVMKQGVLAGYPVEQCPGGGHRRQGAPGELQGGGLRGGRARGLQACLPGGRRRSAGADHERADRRARSQHGRRTERPEHPPRPGPGHGERTGPPVVTATVPLAEILRYSTELRSITGGRGIFTMSLSSYEVRAPARGRGGHRRPAEGTEARKRRTEPAAPTGRGSPARDLSCLWRSPVSARPFSRFYLMLAAARFSAVGWPGTGLHGRLFGDFLPAPGAARLVELPYPGPSHAEPLALAWPLVVVGAAWFGALSGLW